MTTHTIKVVPRCPETGKPLAPFDIVNAEKPSVTPCGALILSANTGQGWRTIKGYAPGTWVTFTLQSDGCGDGVVGD